VDVGFFEKVAEFARENDMIVCHDATYSEITFDGYEAPSLLEAKGSRDIGVEFHTLSKSFCMTGWRVGFAVGHPDIIESLYVTKRVISSGLFRAIEVAGVEALDHGWKEVEDNNRIYKERRDCLIGKFQEIGIDIEPPRGTFYIWIPLWGQESSFDFAKTLIKEAGVIVFPGIGYGQNGEGYIRIALTLNISRLEEAFERIKPFFRRKH
jgi:LL-diaminopimelate aminotransferase